MAKQKQKRSPLKNAPSKKEGQESGDKRGNRKPKKSGR